MKNETKMYILIRSDVNIKTSDLIPSLYKGMIQWFKNCEFNEITKERLEFYIKTQPAFPKICKRYKQKHSEKVSKFLKEQENIPYSEIKINDFIVGYFVGPCFREELNKNIEKLQLLDECLVEIDEGKIGNVKIGFRNDIEIPAGKLIPQFCHAIQKFICEINGNDFTLYPYGMNLKEIEQTSNYITDAGRTYFNKPTITTCYLIC